MKYDVQAIKSVVSCTELCELNGMDISSKGFTKCCFHAEKTGSMKIWPNSYHCFGCGAHGDVIDLARQIYDCSFHNACKILSETYGLASISDDTVRRRRDEARHQKAVHTARMEQLRTRYFDLVAEFRRLEINRVQYAPRSPTDPQHPLFLEALCKYDYIADEMQRAEWDLMDAEKAG